MNVASSLARSAGAVGRPRRRPQGRGRQPAGARGATRRHRPSAASRADRNARRAPRPIGSHVRRRAAGAGEGGTSSSSADGVTARSARSGIASSGIAEFTTIHQLLFFTLRLFVDVFD